MLLVGGASRAALATRKLLSSSDEFAVTVLSRQPIAGYPRETLRQVADYFAAPHELLASTDAVVNFAGLKHGVTRERLWRVNVDGPAQLAATAACCGVQQFVQISSLSVYGDAEDIGRDTPEAPISAYGLSKQAADRTLRCLSSDAFIVTILRVPILYGPRTSTKLHWLATLLSRTRWLPVPTVVQPRSTLHLDNLARAILAVISQQGDGIKFIADPEPFTLTLLAELIRERYNRPVQLAIFPEAAFTVLKLLARDVYNGLYRRSLIRLDECLSVAPFRLTALREALMDILPKSMTTDECQQNPRS